MVLFKPADGPHALGIQLLRHPTVFLTGDEAAKLGGGAGRVRDIFGELVRHVHPDILSPVRPSRVPGENLREWRVVGAVPIVRPDRRAFKKEQVKGSVAAPDEAPEIRVEFGRIIQEDHGVETIQRRRVDGGDAMSLRSQAFGQIYARIAQIISNLRRSSLKHPVLVVLVIKVVKTQIHGCLKIDAAPQRQGQMLSWRLGSWRPL